MGKTGEGHSEHKEIHAPKKATTSGTGGCTAKGCRHSEARFGFCEEHYEHFKFGLIKRSGEPASDYEKKFEHWQAFVARKHAHKVA